MADMGRVVAGLLPPHCHQNTGADQLPSDGIMEDRDGQQGADKRCQLGVSACPCGPQAPDFQNEHDKTYFDAKKASDSARTNQTHGEKAGTQE